MNLNGEACMLLLMTVYHISRNAITDGFLWTCWQHNASVCGANRPSLYGLRREVRVLVCKTWMLIVGWINKADVHTNGFKSSILLLAFLAEYLFQIFSEVFY
jgi:hypothetical protein